MKTIYLLMWEGQLGGGGGGGFEWHPEKQVMVETLANFLRTGPKKTYYWEFEIKVPSTATEDEINEIIENRAEELQNSKVASRV